MFVLAMTVPMPMSMSMSMSMSMCPHGEVVTGSFGAAVHAEGESGCNLVLVLLSFVVLCFFPSLMNNFATDVCSGGCSSAALGRVAWRQKAKAQSQGVSRAC